MQGALELDSPSEPAASGWPPAAIGPAALPRLRRLVHRAQVEAPADRREARPHRM
jgi:hypothetical protein